MDWHLVYIADYGLLLSSDKEMKIVIILEFSDLIMYKMCHACVGNGESYELKTLGIYDHIVIIINIMISCSSE